jgi:hypothetical protein
LAQTSIPQRFLSKKTRKQTVKSYVRGLRAHPLAQETVDHPEDDPDEGGYSQGKLGQRVLFVRLLQSLLVANERAVSMKLILFAGTYGAP